MTKTRFHIGDRVRFQLGTYRRYGTVVEDRGLIGVGGRQIVRIEIELDATCLRVFELPAALLTAA
jgi:hypothetical protein